MQLVGATKGFIRRPFVIKGIMQGIYAGIIAVALLVGLLYLAQREIPELLFLQDEQLIAILFGFVILLGVLISWFSTFLAVRKYLRLKTDDLY